MNHPVHLGLDTSSADVTVSAIRGADSAQVQLELGKTSAHLIRAIDDLLNRLEATPRDLGSLACSAGPGSFTGIRIGLATALGLAEGLDLPAAAVSAHWVQAWAAQQNGGSRGDRASICSVLPSHGGRWSIQHFRLTDQPRAESAIETVVEIPDVPLVTSQPRCRRHLEDNGREALWVAPLAHALARIAATVAQGDTPIVWDRSSLLQPVYGAGPAVSTAPRVRQS